MKKAHLPTDEELRLQDLYQYDLLDSCPEDEFNDLVELAAQICNCPISLLSLLDRDRQWFKAKKGFGETETARDIALCAHTILQDEVFQVPDAEKDERFVDNPLVTGGPNIRFYAGTPIVSPTGYKIGTLCLIDHQPRTFSEPEEKALKLLARQASKLLELRMKNQVLRRQAEEIIALKQRAVEVVLEQEQASRATLSYQLHEEIAQSLAASLMVLGNTDGGCCIASPVLNEVKTQLKSTLQDVRQLSYSIQPPSLHVLTSGEFFGDWMKEARRLFPFELETSNAPSKLCLPAEKSLLLLRVLKEWLSVLACCPDCRKVSVRFETGQPNRLLIEDDASACLSKRNEWLNSLAIVEKAESMGSKVVLKKSATRRHVFDINIEEDRRQLP